MPQTAEWEERNIRQYVEGQLHDGEDGVTLVQGVGQERVLGRTHLMYDVHTVKGRWWVITEPTNLYDQERFPELDYTLSFHLGLGLRIAQRSRVEADDDRREHAEGAWRRYAAAVEAMNTANDAEDFQAVGVKCREALLALARENHDASWVGKVADPPKGDDLKGWMTIFAAKLLPAYPTAGSALTLRTSPRKPGTWRWACSTIPMPCRWTPSGRWMRWSTC